MSTPSITTSGSRRRSHAKPRGRRRSRSRRQQARSLAEQLRAEQVTSPSSSVLRGNRRRSTQPTQQHENVPLSKRAPVKVSRATLMAFYGGIGIASEGTKALQEGRLPARGKTLSTLGYSTIHHEKPRVGTATTTAAATTDTATGADTQEQTGEGKVGNAGAGESTSAGGQEAKKPVLLSVPHCEEIRLQHLFMATVRGDEEVVKRFLDAGEPADSRPARFPNETPLHAAALLGNVSMVRCVPQVVCSLVLVCSLALDNRLTCYICAVDRVDVLCCAVLCCCAVLLCCAVLCCCAVLTVPDGDPNQSWGTCKLH